MRIFSQPKRIDGRRHAPVNFFSFGEKIERGGFCCCVVKFSLADSPPTSLDIVYIYVVYVMYVWTCRTVRRTQGPVIIRWALVSGIYERPSPIQKAPKEEEKKGGKEWRPNSYSSL